MFESITDNLGEPHIKLEGLQIWVHQREFPDAIDYWDANWLMITALCKAQNAVVQTSGPLIHLSEIVDWLNQCKKLRATLSGQANIKCMEPELSVYLKADDELGHISMRVEITPDPLKQAHSFEFEIDQTYLESLIESCQKVLFQYPLKYAKDVSDQKDRTPNFHDFE